MCLNNYIDVDPIFFFLEMAAITKLHTVIVKKACTSNIKNTSSAAKSGDTATKAGDTPSAELDDKDLGVADKDLVTALDGYATLSGTNGRHGSQSWGHAERRARR